tara:strand:- start:603 stop:1040 length:438 start_codon:yes stop_codon:yes gene_type:complete
MEKNMINIKNLYLTEDTKVPAETSKDYVEYAYTANHCANLDKHIELVSTDNFAIARNNYGHVKYLEVAWKINPKMCMNLCDMEKTPLEELVFIVQEFIHKNLYRKMHWENNNLDVHLNFYEDELECVGDNYYLSGLIKEIYDYHP